MLEVELVSHSFERHVLQQVRAFEFGEPDADCAVRRGRHAGQSVEVETRASPGETLQVDRVQDRRHLHMRSESGSNIVGDALGVRHRAFAAARAPAKETRGDGPTAHVIVQMPQDRSVRRRQRAQDVHLQAVRVDEVRTERIDRMPKRVRIGRCRCGSAHQAC